MNDEANIPRTIVYKGKEMRVEELLQKLENQRLEIISLQKQRSKAMRRCRREEDLKPYQAELIRLQQYLEEKRSTYEIPARVTFTQVYFNVDERGQEQAVEAARALAQRLNASGELSSDVSALGDPFLLQSTYANRPIADIRGEFGPHFARAVSEQEPRTWQGPVASGYGVHAVRVHERTDATLPDWSDLREELRADWMTDRQREMARRAYETLRRRYQVLVEGMPYDLDMSG